MDWILSPGLLLSCPRASAHAKGSVWLHRWRWRWSMQPWVLAACGPRPGFVKLRSLISAQLYWKSWCWALREHKPKPRKVRKVKTQREAKLLSHKLSAQEKTTDMWQYKTPRNKMRATQQGQGSVISNKEVDASPSDWRLPGQQILMGCLCRGQRACSCWA